MPDPTPPPLPPGAPRDLEDFIGCRRTTWTFASGPLTWLTPPPKITLTPGDQAGTGTISVEIGESPFATTIDLPTSIAGGELHVETSGVGMALEALGAKGAIDAWVRDFNAWLKANGVRLQDASIRRGTITLVKEPIAPTSGQSAGSGMAGQVAAGGGTPPGRSAGSKPTVPPPSPPASPATPQPPGGCLRWLGAGLLVAVIAVIGVTATGLLNPGPSPTATAPAASPTTGPGSPAPTPTGAPTAPPSAPGPAALLRVSPIDAVFTPATFSTTYSLLLSPTEVPLLLNWSGPNCGSWSASDERDFTWTHPHPPCDATTDHHDVAVTALGLAGESVAGSRVSGPTRAFRCTYQGAETGAGPACVTRTLGRAEIGVIDARSLSDGATPAVTMDAAAWARLAGLLN